MTTRAETPPPHRLEARQVLMFALVQIGVWTAFGAIEFMQYQNEIRRRPGADMLDAVVESFLPAAIALAITSALAPALIRFRRWRGWRWVAATVGACVAGGLAFAALHMESKYWLGLYEESRLDHPYKVLVYGWSQSLLIGLWAAVFFAVTTAREMSAQAMTVRTLERDAARARLQMLRYQINPHFLFNALNTVSGLILGGRPEQAEIATQKLAAFLRHSLEAPEAMVQHLGEEIRGIELYLAVERTRFGDRLETAFDIDPTLARLDVPALILQPLIENAMKHGVSRCERGGRIGVIAKRITAPDGAGAQIQVLNTPFSDAAAEIGDVAPISLGLGLRNVAERLRNAYGDAASLRLERIGEHGFCATLTLPLKGGSEGAS